MENQRTKHGGMKTKNITRRSFLKQTLTGIGGIMLAKSLGSNIGLAQPSADMSRVVVVRHPGATDGVKTVNEAIVQTMMDESIKRLTGKPSVADAWASILPDFKEEHVIAIKVNANGVRGVFLATCPEVVNAIVTGLTAAGVLENNIIVYDRINRCLTDSGYKLNVGDVGVRCFGTDEKGWGYDWGNPVNILGQKRALTSIVTQCHHLINVPVLKALPDIWQGKAFEWGVSLSLKNHYGTVDNPSSLHDNFPAVCATLNSQEAIKNKTRLVVMDALFGSWQGRVPAPPDFVYNGLVVSKDPVVADYIGTEIINEERAKHDQPPKEVPVLQKAAEMGLGTNNPDEMQVIQIAQNVDIKDKRLTTWGKIKRKS